MADDNIKILKIDEKEERADNTLDDDYILSKERPSVASRITNSFVQQKNRFTEIDNTFEDEEEEEENSFRQSNIRKSERPSKISNIEKTNTNIIINNNNMRITEKKNSKTISSIKNILDIKIIILGDISVGKTSILGRYINNSFEEKYKCTIQVECKTKVIDIDLNTAVKMTIWDTCGQEKYRILTKQYYRNCDGAIIVFDLTNKKTFEYVNYWIEELRKNAPENISILIAGNKSDLTFQKKIRMEEIQKLIDNNYLYYEVSAKTGNNISLVFDKLRNNILESLKNKKNKDELDIRFNMNPLDPKSLDKLGKSVNKSKKCC